MRDLLGVSASNGVVWERVEDVVKGGLWVRVGVWCVEGKVERVARLCPERWWLPGGLWCVKHGPWRTGGLLGGVECKDGVSEARRSREVWMAMAMAQSSRVACAVTHAVPCSTVQQQQQQHQQQQSRERVQCCTVVFQVWRGSGRGGEGREETERVQHSDAPLDSTFYQS